MEGAYAGMVYIWAWLAFYEQRTRSIGPVPFFQFRQGRQCIIVPNCWLASHPAGPMTSPWPVSTKHQMLGNQPCSLLPDRRPWLKFGKQGPPASLSKLALATPALHSGLQGRVYKYQGSRQNRRLNGRFLGPYINIKRHAQKKDTLSPVRHGRWPSGLGHGDQRSRCSPVPRSVRDGD